MQVLPVTILLLCAAGFVAGILLRVVGLAIAGNADRRLAEIRAEQLAREQRLRS